LGIVRSAGGEGSDFVLDAAAGLTPGDASSLAAVLERSHLLWFDEPCPLSNLSAACRIAGENVTPLGFGRFATEAGMFQHLLRHDAVDVVRPDLGRHGVTQVRRIAAVAEPYYVAIAPFHDGGPIATAAALHLAASLPNFFIQQVPYPAAEEDRRMRARLVPALPRNVRTDSRNCRRDLIGNSVNDAALAEYREREA
jgi:galactonate dehydratase